MTTKLALIRQRYRPDGGAERFISRALERLGSQELEVTVITRKWQDQKGNFKVLTCNPTKWGRISRERGFARQVCQLLEQHHFDLVQSHERLSCCDIYRAGDGVHKVWLEQRKRILSPLQRKLLDLSPYHRYVCQAEKSMFESHRLKAVICNSHMVKEEILANFRLEPEKISVIYNGIDTEVFTPALRDQFRQKRREEMEFNDQEIVAIFVGSGFERKGLESAIRALSACEKPVRLIVVGTDKHLNHYQQLAVQLGVTVHWAGVQKDVRPYYAAADFLLLPTLYDPFPNVIFEAMACALPVITSKKCGGAELIKEGINGYTSDSLDITSIANAISELDHPERCLTMGDSARQTVEAYSLDQMGEQLTALYAHLLCRT
ncbi:glycosyl transferase family 1 [Hahella sp. CCB-MM4]|uniref:glycosyltransferase family 4 protein n=1 Tax=Hahella sp. (strain CCB-MM4) TaxID=1926491 RepID=UPI000B9AF550|nr:glycosyltransferase family 4 protein [Hahella sp. CCB-MM4]OZG74914.1 glycosyl transferase family 1 [Hahella sp. CCB-MM4]